MKPGKAFPLGSTVTESGVNFSIFSSHATSMHLVLFDSEDAPLPHRTIPLDPKTNRTGHYWHVEIPNLRAGQVYGYRADGPFLPERGYRFDGNKLLLDPYAKAVSGKLYQRKAAEQPGTNDACSLRSVVVDLNQYDWEGDTPLRHSFHNTVIYELHVAGFTRHPNSNVPEEERGTFAGLIRKIPYLKQLGVTAIELMPVFQFDWQDAPPGLENYWGYSPVSFFAPHLPYSVSKDPVRCITEFRDMVKAFHRADIEVILDVVYNHTAEADDVGPTLCWKGLDNSLYYTLTEDRSQYADFTGTGNTLNANQSIVRRMILDSLRYWVAEMHVDGFRFDLASVLSRNESGDPISNSPVLWDIDSEPVLAGTKLIAEAWDAAGLYQVGSFSKDHWKEWNGRFRDDIRSFLKSDAGLVRNLRQRLLGSPDLYTERFHPPEQSINFVTCHDGFTLNDLVSYNEKHNAANGQQSQDGSNDNLSWNCGVEGPTEDTAIDALRSRQIRNALTLTLISVGTPMLLMGDEVRRTQLGNNNAYCQNNPTSWFDWEGYARETETFQFTARMIELRKHFSASFGGRFVSLSDLLENARLDWHGVTLHHPDYSDNSRTLAVTGYVPSGPAFHLMLNFYWEPLEFEVPPVPAGCSYWFPVLDTFDTAPPDPLNTRAKTMQETHYTVQPRSIVLLASNGIQWTWAGSPTQVSML